MGEQTAISWTDHTWNPWIGCTKVSPACDGCYAAALMGDQGRYKRVVWGEPGKGAGTRVETSSATFNAPLKWDRAARAAGVKRFVFVASLADIFDNEVPIEWLAKVFAMMRRTPNLIYLALTKRPQLIVKRFKAACPGEDWPENVFAGTTTEDQTRLDLNAPALLKAKSALGIPSVFLSMEPLLGPVRLRAVKYDQHPASFGKLDALTKGVDWVITGGETDQGGHKARPTHPDWLRAIRDACEAAGVPYHHKQNGEWTSGEGWYADHPVSLPLRTLRDGEWTDDGNADGEVVVRIGKKAAGRLLDGVLHDAMPGAALSSPAAADGAAAIKPQPQV